MQRIIFTEEFCQPENLHPFTLTRQVQDIRVGILTIREKWERALKLESFDKFEDDYKDLERSIRITKKIGSKASLMVQGNVMPTPGLLKAIRKLKNGECISVKGADAVVFRFSAKEVEEPHRIRIRKAIEIEEELSCIRYPWNIFQLNDAQIRADFKLLTSGRRSANISKTNRVISTRNIFIEKGAVVEHSILNATDGPIYIGKNAKVMEGCMIRGPFALGEASVLKMGTKVYGATSIGPYCNMAGEIKNSVVFGYTNKAHDGYLGDSVLGEWCNLGAGTSNSNMKNNAGEVRVWTPHGEISAGQKCGLMMGDYSRSAVNTSFTTGSVVGVCSNLFGTAQPPRYLPSFSWGNDGIDRYKFDKALEDIESWKKMKNGRLTENEKTILKYIFENY